MQQQQNHHASAMVGPSLTSKFLLKCLQTFVQQNLEMPTDFVQREGQQAKFSSGMRYRNECNEGSHATEIASVKVQSVSEDMQG